MKTSYILFALAAVLLTIFGLSVAWEFYFEDLIAPHYIDDFATESLEERWEYVVTAILFSTLALLVPAILLLRASRKLRVIHEDLEARVQARTEALQRELTEGARMTAQLTEARNTAETANAARALFLANMSHELRTPLSAVISMSDVLSHTKLSPRQQQHLQAIRTSGEVLLGIIDGLLDFSRLEAGKYMLHSEDFELRRMLEGIVDTLAYQAREKGLKLFCRVDADVPDRLRGDSVALRQVLLNLVGNAIKFTDQGEVDIQVSMSARAATRCDLRFTVRDTGIGVDPTQATQLFEPFVQAESSSQRRYGGTGLGLSICKSLVDAMQGRIGVETPPQGGSLFWCEIRFDLGQASDVKTTTVPAFDVQRNTKGGPRRVLVVEDESVIRAAMQLMLEHLGFEVTVAASGEKALAALATQAFGAILVDCLMAEMDGYELTARIRARESEGPHVPIIALTALVTDSDRERCIAAGMDDYLSKPVTEAMLHKTLKRWLAEPDLGEPRGQANRLEGREWEGLRAVQAATPESVPALVDLFLEDASARIDTLCNALEAGNKSELAKTAHGLKGACLQLGAREMADLCSKLEDCGRSADRQAAEALLVQLSEEFERACARLAGPKGSDTQVGH